MLALGCLLEMHLLRTGDYQTFYEGERAKEGVLRAWYHVKLISGISFVAKS